MLIGTSFQFCAGLRAPAGLTYSTNPAVYSNGVAITANNPSSTGGAIASYSVSPALPTGLSLNTTTGVITGTPSGAFNSATYVITATNITGFTTANLVITVFFLNETFFAGYASTINGDRGYGSLTGTSTGTVVITSGKLDLTAGGTTTRVDYDPVGNADSVIQTGTVVVDWTPNYAAPGTARVLFTITATATNANCILVYHTAASGMQVQFYNSSGTLIINTNVGTLSVSSGTSYHIELDFDLTTGATRLFVNGTQLGSTIATTLTRTSAIGVIKLGNDRTNASAPNHKLDNFQIFTTVQHTSDYTYP